MLAPCAQRSFQFASIVSTFAILFACFCCIIQGNMDIPHRLFSTPSAHTCSEHGVFDLAQCQDAFQARSVDQLPPYDNSIFPSGPQQLGSPNSGYTGRQQVAAASQHPGNMRPQHEGMTAFCMEKPEEIVGAELGRLYSTLHRAERYQKYREKQPVLTPAEVMARDAADEKDRRRREAESLPQSQKDSTVWPDFLEHAFWRALVRWPPMGRKKYTLGGVLKGRNELIQDSIYRDTGITRDRKQISSHLQVLKAHLKDFSVALAYMGIMEDSPKRRRGSVTYQLPQSPQLHSPQHTQGADATVGDGCCALPHTWAHVDGAPTYCTPGAASYSYENQSYGHFPTPLSSEILACLQPDLDPMNALASCVGGEHGQPGSPFSSHPNLPCWAYDSDFDIARDGTNMPDTGTQSNFDMPAYEGLDDASLSTACLHTLPGFEHQPWAPGGVAGSEQGYFVPVAANTDVGGPVHVACYAARPNPTHVENVAEQYQACGSNERYGRDQAVFCGDDYHGQAPPCGDLAGCGGFWGQDEYR